MCSSHLFAQKSDSALAQRAKPSYSLIPQDTLSAGLVDKYILSELEKVQYAAYSENLKEEALRKVLENQKLKTASLEQKLLTERLKAEAARKQVEAERRQAEARRRQAVQKQQIKQLEITQLSQRVILQNRTRNFLFAGLGLLSLLGVSLLWSNRQLKKRNKSIKNLSAENLIKEQEKQQILAIQNETLEHQVAERTDALKTSLEHLKTTQNQLVYKEKMASLGELTAGIAHEIQNPLNFVNNFSELSTELVEELEEEQQKADRDLALEAELLTDLKDNLHKIFHHGSRASNIVKGMLGHSRSSTGEVLPTNLNALTDEYLRLAYHGLRANDKSFNCELVTQFDASVEEVAVMPQEIGRVLLNLFSNAFYAVRQRQQTGSGEDYQPMVSVSTGQADGQAFITVRDNGTGMPESVQQKIFQPFFTTKPTGQGTGLGLSLSYDIVTKGHEGSLTVTSQEGQGTEFVVQLPI